MLTKNLFSEIYISSSNCYLILVSTDNSRPFAQFHNDRNYEEVAVEVDQSDVIDPVWNILPQDQLNSKFCIDAIRELQKKSGT